MSNKKGGFITGVMVVIIASLIITATGYFFTNKKSAYLFDKKIPEIAVTSTDKISDLPLKQQESFVSTTEDGANLISTSSAFIKNNPEAGQVVATPIDKISNLPLKKEEISASTTNDINKISTSSVTQSTCSMKDGKYSCTSQLVEVQFDERLSLKNESKWWLDKYPNFKLICNMNYISLYKCSDGVYIEEAMGTGVGVDSGKMFYRNPDGSTLVCPRPYFSEECYEFLNKREENGVDCYEDDICTTESVTSFAGQVIHTFGEKLAIMPIGGLEITKNFDAGEYYITGSSNFITFLIEPGFSYISKINISGDNNTIYLCESVYRATIIDEAKGTNIIYQNCNGGFPSIKGDNSVVYM